MTFTSNGARFIALGSRLQDVPEVRTLGVRPNFFDYTEPERVLILEAPMVLFPTRHYAKFFSTLNRRIFPSLETHLYADEKILQTTLFQMLGLPHPKTRFYFRRHRDEILNDFSFPFIAKLPRASSQGRGVFLISGEKELRDYLGMTRVAYIQEYLPHERDLRVVLVNYDPVLAYWRLRPPGGFKANLSQGGEAVFYGVPSEALDFAVHCARKCRFDDVGLDLIQHHGRWYLIEANMKYGRKGLMMKDLNLKEIIRKKLLDGEIKI